MAQAQLETAMLLMSYGTKLNARNGKNDLRIDIANNEMLKQAIIRDEPKRRKDHRHKRATEQNRHPNAAAAASASVQQQRNRGISMRKQ